MLTPRVIIHELRSIKLQKGATRLLSSSFSKVGLVLTPEMNSLRLHSMKLLEKAIRQL